MSKINCPYHPDDTASMHLYEDHAYCFGCGITVPHDKLKTAHPFRRGTSYRKKKEDIDKSLARIAALPTKTIRGLELPYDDTGYYIVYPIFKYYIKRLWEPEDNDKYRSPAGHRKPFFIAKKGTSSVFIVEGQLNALTLAIEYSGEAAIVSPGSCTDLKKKEVESLALQFPKISVIVDYDPSGSMAGLTLKSSLRARGKRVNLITMKKDLNEIYVTEGQSGLRKAVKDIEDISNK